MGAVSGCVCRGPCAAQPAELTALVRANPSLIARGNGRAYGDSAINHRATLRMTHLNRMQAFEETTGQLIAEPGVTLGEILETFLPRGWFPLVSPGTRYVTLGGAIAADVHGKNHHKDGSFRNCVEWVEVMDADGAVTRCSATENATLFDHTLGGMGLTGIVTCAAIRLKRVPSAWIRQETRPARNLKAAMEVFEENLDATYSVAWIDCLALGFNLGRSLVMLGEHAAPEELARVERRAPFAWPTKPKTFVPFDFPAPALNPLSVRAFNALYYWKGARARGPEIVDWDSYIYPLDAITLDHGGRFYLAKDSRMSRATFAASDPRVAAFRETRQEQTWQESFASAQSEILAL